eukprot:TRINITY_DN116713_c0_g1_i1.p1 TRINITY_DN116713_c0_g1~~TRINITY_DN116713_c0_g1_i1.p1  ORF type:complete len:193 (+),score=56.25 TRINITY_DN116713_c0_g1_i1:77-655(+)
MISSRVVLTKLAAATTQRSNLSWRLLPQSSGVACRQWRQYSSDAGATDSAGSTPAQSKAEALKDAMSEQRNVLFPHMTKLEAAWEEQDAVRRKTSTPSTEWSPKKVPYRTFEKHSTVDDDDDDEDSDEECEDTAKEAAMEMKQASAEENAAGGEEGGEVEGLEVDEEVGFRYSGPEPTIFGDWAHKGRVTDF